MQRISTRADAAATLGGSFQLFYGDEATTDLAFNIVADDDSVPVGSGIDSVETAGLKQVLESLPSIVTVTVSRTALAGTFGANAYEWYVTFDSVLTPDIPLLYAEGRLLSGENSRIVAEDACAWAPLSATPAVSGVHGDSWLVRLSGASSLHGDARFEGTHGSGVCNVSYLTPRVGVYSMDVSLGVPGGLSAAYCNNRWMFRPPALKRVDSVINFAWESFITETGHDYVSARWVGYVQPAFNEDYTFVVRVNDGAKLWVDGVVIIDEYGLEAESDALVELSGTTATLTARRLYDIQLEYRENTGFAGIELLWQSNSQPLSLVPSDRLYPPWTALSCPRPTAWSPWAWKPRSPRRRTLRTWTTRPCRSSGSPSCTTAATT